VERVHFSKDGGLLQLTAVDVRRTTVVVVPNDLDLINVLATNGVDISVSKGEAAGPGGFLAFVGNLLFPFLAFVGLFFLFRRVQGGPGAGPWTMSALPVSCSARRMWPAVCARTRRSLVSW